MPWQRDLYDTALEIDPKTGQLVYREVRVTVPRQSGKTAPIIARKIWRSMRSQYLGGRQAMLYAAQTRNDARKKWERDFVETLKASKAMQGRYHVKFANGSEHIRFRDGSTFGPISVTAVAGHGETLDDGTLDEAFAQVDDRVEAAWNPAMITRRHAQLWVISTAGTDASTYLRGKVEHGRALAEEGRTRGVCYVEYSADESADPGDPRVWRQCMPALGHTIPEEAIQALWEKHVEEGNVAGFRRAYLNQWTSAVVDSVIPIGSWRKCADPTSKLAGRPVLSFDVSPDRSTAAIAMAGRNVRGRPHVEVAFHGTGTSWVVPKVVELVAKWHPADVVVDRNSPAAALVPELLRQLPYLSPTLMTAGQSAQACGQLYDGARDPEHPRSYRHLGDPLLEQALAGADRRILGDAWAWRRKTSTSDICPLVAVTNALWSLSINTHAAPAFAFSS